MANTKTARIASLESKIAALQAKLEEVRALPDAAAPAEEFIPVTGAVYDFKFGRGDSATILRGTCLGVREPAEGEKGGRIAKFLVGEGYNADIKGVFLSAVIKPELTGAGDVLVVDSDGVAA